MKYAHIAKCPMNSFTLYPKRVNKEKTTPLGVICQNRTSIESGFSGGMLVSVGGQTMYTINLK